MQLIIRDDDVSYFTEPEDLDRLYNGIWEYVPIHLSVIPFVRAIAAEVPLDKRDGRAYLISSNYRLCNYLKEKIKEKKVVIWQHGFTHQDFGTGKHEFETDSNLIELEIEMGKKQLEQTFGVPVKVCVAPHDRWSKTCVQIIEKLDMNICRAFAPLPREFMWRKEYLECFVYFFRLWYHYKKKYRPDNWLYYGKHRELYSYRIDEITFENIDNIIEKHKYGILAVTVHHRTLNKFGLEKLKYIIKRMGKNEIKR